MDQMLQSEDVRWLNGLKKNKIQLYVAYKKLARDIKTQRPRVRDGKIHSMQMEVKKNPGEVMAISENNSNTKAIIRDKGYM